MSLIICSNNRTDADESIGGNDSIFEPWSFRNQMTSNVEIPADAQVALQSVKVNMDGTIVLGDDTKVFYMYFGPAMVGPEFAATRITNIMESPQMPIRVPLFAEHDSRLEKMSMLDLAIEIQRSVRERITNPNLKNRFTCVAEYNADGTFKGFKWTFNEAITGAGSTGYAPTSTIPPVFNHLAVSQRGMLDAVHQGTRVYQISNGGVGVAPLWTYQILAAPPAHVGYGQFQITQERRRSEAIIGNVSPLNLKGGEVKYRITDTATGLDQGRFMCGLTRGSRQMPGAPLIGPPHWRRSNGNIAKPWLGCAFADFFCYYNHAGGQGDFGPVAARGKLRIGHSVVDEDDTGGRVGNQRGMTARMKFADFQYGDGSGVLPDTGTDPLVIASTNWDDLYGYSLIDNPLFIEFICFKVDGGRVTIYMESTVAAGSVKYDLVTYGAARNKEDNLKPITQNCENLLPVMLLNNDGNSRIVPPFNINLKMEIAKWDGNNVSCINYDFLSDDMAENGLFDRWYAGNPQTKNQIHRMDLIECVNYSNRYHGAPNILHEYMGVGAAAPTEFTNVSHIWSVMPNQEYGGPGSMLTAGANSGRFLGLENTPILRSWTLSAEHNRESASTTVPRLLPTRSIFVRLENFGNESVNAFQGLRSKIIGHLPRFDGFHWVGPLYLEPKNLVYVDLKNPSSFRINSFDLSLCYSDETYATSLQGTTIIVLHIKKKGE